MSLSRSTYRWLKSGLSVGLILLLLAIAPFAVAQDVHHDGPRLPCVGRTEGQVEHGAGEVRGQCVRKVGDFGDRRDQGPAQRLP